MTYDLIIRGGSVIDGTGAPRVRADLAITDGVISAIGDLASERGEREIDATGLIVAPGFIDSHTHLESQLFWDRAALPASEHGSTTIILGNCGLSFAPIGQVDRDFGARLMSAVEQIPRTVIDKEVPFDWNTFGEFVESIDRAKIGVNAASFVGYSLIRHAAMGERAFDDPATADDIAAMQALVVEAIDAGALGVSFNRCTYDHDDEGRPMIGWDVDWSEIAAVLSVLKGRTDVVLQVIPSWSDMREGWTERFELELNSWIEILKDLDVSLVWSAVSEADYEVQMEATRRARAAGVRFTAGIHSIPIYTFASFEAPGLFAATYGLRELYEVSAEERLAMLADPQCRAEIREKVGEDTFVAYPLRYVAEDGREVLGNPRHFSWSQIFRAGAAPARFDLSDSVAEVAAAEGKHPVDVVLDAAIASDLKDVFVVFVHGNLREATRELLKDEATVISSNDTGAHLMLMAQTQTTHLLDYWSRETGFLSLEEAVHLLSGRQADVFGLADRGVLEVGRAGDVIVFNPDEVGPQAPALVGDLPGGGNRYVAGALGIEHVIVNGAPLLSGGQPTGDFAGGFLPRGRD